MRALALLAAIGSVLGGAMPLAAQGRPLTVSGVRGLTFGTVLPGLPRAISRTDPANSGQFDLAGAKFATVQLTFSLPAAMVGPAGATMPLSFGSSDAGYSSTQSIGSQIGFDPRLPFIALLSKNGRGSVFIGGTANPATSQRAGTYTGTVTLTVAYIP